MTTIDYYISLNSPWTFLGSERFIAMTAKAGATVRTKPAKFGDVFAVTGGLPLPKRAPARQAYRMMELKRWRDRLGIPIKLEPKHFPSDETAGVRLVIAAEQAGENALKFSSEIGRALWVHDDNIADMGVLEAAAQRAGVDLAKLRALGASDAALDAAWTANTEEAIARGVFGAPSYVFPSGEILWGQDRVMFVETLLADPAA